MAWTSVSPHGISAAEGLDDVPAMSASGNTLFAAGYDTGSERAAELWAASIGDEHWRLVHRISGMRRPESMAVHGGTGESALFTLVEPGSITAPCLYAFTKYTGYNPWLSLSGEGGLLLRC